jgi:hypothetical protein
MTTTKDKNFCTFLLGTAFVIRWMPNDCFAHGKGEVVIDENYEPAMRAVMRVFLEAIEMGALAKQFPARFFRNRCLR